MMLSASSWVALRVVVVDEVVVDVVFVVVVDVAVNVVDEVVVVVAVVDARHLRGESPVASPSTRVSQLSHVFV